MCNIPENMLSKILYDTWSSSTIRRNILQHSELYNKLDKEKLYNTLEGIKMVIEYNKELLNLNFDKIKKETYPILLEDSYVLFLKNKDLVIENVRYDITSLKDIYSYDDHIILNLPFYLIYNNKSRRTYQYYSWKYPSAEEKKPYIYVTNYRLFPGKYFRSVDENIGMYGVSDIYHPDGMNVVLYITKYKIMKYSMNKRLKIKQYKICGLTHGKDGIYQ